MSYGKSQEALDAMMCGYSKANRDAARMVMFKAYFDDSCGDVESNLGSRWLRPKLQSLGQLQHGMGSWTCDESKH